MIPDSVSPQSQHTPEGNEDTEEIGHQKHSFGFKLEVFLDVPETEG
jgi:hypothetical protein